MASCAELTDAAAEALGLAGRPARPTFAPPVLVRRRRAIFVAGLVLLAASITAGVLALTGGDGETEPLANGVAALDPAEGGIASLTESTTVPGNVAVGEDGVWVLNSRDESVSRIDPESKEIVKTFKPGGVPSEIAAGEGAVWVGNAGGSAQTSTEGRNRATPWSASRGSIPARRGSREP